MSNRCWVPSFIVIFLVSCLAGLDLLVSKELNQSSTAECSSTVALDGDALDGDNPEENLKNEARYKSEGNFKKFKIQT